MTHASFLHYLKGQLRRDDPIGDFAKDAVIDPNFPGEFPDSMKQLRQYLHDAHASEAAIRAGEAAYQEYRQGFPA